jgi:hypothetical protein
LYLSLTAHFCSRDENGHLVVVNRLLAFRIVEGKHDGKNIVKLMFSIIKDAKILHKVPLLLLFSLSVMISLEDRPIYP